MAKPRTTVVTLVAFLAVLGAFVAWTWWSFGSERALPASAPLAQFAHESTRETLVAPTPEAAAVPAPSRQGADAQPPASAFEPERALALTGRVLAAADHQPIEGAAVTALYTDGRPLADAFSDESGSYRIELEGGVPASIALSARREGFAPCAPQLVPLAGTESDVTLDLELEPPIELRGQVESGRDGKPLRGARVHVSSALPCFGEFEQEAETDGDGRFAFEALDALPRAGLVLDVRAAGHLPLVRRDLSAAESGTTPLELKLRLAGSLRLRGRVVSAVDDKPIEGAQVTLATLEPMWSDGGDDTATDEQGGFDLELAESAPESACLHLVAPGHAAKTFLGLAPPLSGEVIDLGRVGLSLARGVRGSVRERGTRKPLAGVDVRAVIKGVPHTLEEQFGEETVSAADGGFALTLESVPADACVIVATLPGYRTVRVAPTAALELELDAVPVLRGRVLRRADGRAVAGARVRLLAPPERESFAPPPATCDARGEYRLELDPECVKPCAIIVEHLGRRFLCGTIAHEPDQRELVRDFNLELPVPKSLVPAGPSTPR